MLDSLHEFAKTVNGSDREVFVHEMSSEHGVRWHFGACFPGVDSCALGVGADLDATSN